MKRMKRLLAILFAVLLLCGCGAKRTPLPETAEPSPAPLPAPPPAEEVIVYEIGERTEARSEEADDGTTLLRCRFQLPQLRVLLNGEPLKEAASDAQRQALSRAETFNAEFDRWLAENEAGEAASMAREHYSMSPEFFAGMYYMEDLTCTAYRRGSVVSVFGTYDSFLGGAHGNTTFMSWNFDLDSGAFFHIPELAREHGDFTLFVADEIEAQAAEKIKDPAWGGEGMTLDELYWPDYREILEQWSDYAASFTEEGLQIVFSPYDLAPYAAGPQEFLLPYETLEPWWSDSGRILLGLNP